MKRPHEGPWFANENLLQVTDKKVWFDRDGSRHGETPNWVIECQSGKQARLIAAAPDLLEALKNLVDTAKILWDSAKPIKDSASITVTHPVIEAARAAIAKAEGL